MEEEIKKFLKENLEVHILWGDQNGSGNHQSVGLKFRGDDEWFHVSTIPFYTGG